jgi:hypothetical protein
MNTKLLFVSDAISNAKKNDKIYIFVILQQIGKLGLMR